MGSLLAGENAGVPSPFDFALGGQGEHPFYPLGACGMELKEGMAVMVDMAGNYTPYMTDMTRVFSVGKLADEACRAHRVSLDIHERIGEIAKPGSRLRRSLPGSIGNSGKSRVKRLFYGNSPAGKIYRAWRGASNQ